MQKDYLSGTDVKNHISTIQNRSFVRRGAHIATPLQWLILLFGIILSVFVVSAHAQDSNITALLYYPPINTGNNNLLYSQFAPANENGGLIAERQGDDKLIGQAWGDYDNDGWLDLYVTDSEGANILFHNEEGILVISTLSEQVALTYIKSSGTVFADYDNDGWLDLYVVNDGDANVLFRNENGISFVDVTETANVGDTSHGRSASWGDYDNDGDLDLYIANWSCSPHCGHPSQGDRDTLYRNNGDGTFRDVTSSLLNKKVYGAGFIASFIDFDNDGDLDIYLVNDAFVNPVGNALWRNDGAGCNSWCFTEISEETNSDTVLMGMGLLTGDIDNDMDVDFFFSNAGAAVLLQNQGNTFSNMTEANGLLLPNLPVSWGTILTDFDNDGWRDIYLAVTETLPARSTDDVIFINSGDGTFTALEADLTHTGYTLGVAYADYDNDGWVDLVVGNYDEGYYLYHNEGARLSDNARTTIILEGAQIIGARVIVEANGIAQMQDVQSGSSLGSGNASDLYFGLGTAQIFDLTVIWTDGRQQSFSGLAANQRYVVQYES
jgi:enediyne biosynthesis protein E4